MQLRKACNHPYLFMDYIEPEFLGMNLFRTSGKFELLDRMLNKLILTGHKILIFSQYVQIMTIFEWYFNFRGLKYLQIDGACKHDERFESLRKFTDEGEYKIFLLSTRAGG